MESLLNAQLQANPDVPKYYFFKILTTTFKDQAEAEELSFENRREFKNSKNSALIKYGEEILEKFENVEYTPENKFYMGNIYGFLGRMYGVERSYMSAFSNAKEGKDLLEELVEEYPDFYDAYLLLGMFEYYADRLGGFIEFVAGILGFSGDRTTGLEYLKLVCEKGDLTKPLAEFILAETYSFQERNDFEAVKYFESLVKEYPNNKSFTDWYLRLLINLDRLTEARDVIDNADENIISDFTKGYYFFKLGNLEQANFYFGKTIETKKVKWGSAYREAIFYHSVTSLLLGNQVKETEIEFDESDREIFNEIKSHPSSVLVAINYIAFVGTMNQGENNNFNIPKLSELSVDGYINSLVEFNTGVYYFKKGDYKKAADQFELIGKTGKYNKYDSVKYLIEIYKRIDATSAQLETLEDLVDELDSEALDFNFEDLEKKYDL